MVKEKRILSYFIGWLIVGFIIIFIGVNDVYAQTTSTYQDIGYLNDVTILYSLSEDPPNPVEIPRNNEYQLENVFKFIVEIENYTFNAGTTYAIELSIPETKINNNFYSVIASDGTSCSIGSTNNTNSPYPTFIFNCPKNTNSLTLNIYNSDNSYVLNSGIFRWNYIFLRKQITTTDTSILENQQSQMIEQNQQIIQGQEEIKDTIKDQLNDCRDSYNLINYKNFINMNSNTSINIIKDGIIIIKNNNSTGYGIQSEILNLKANTTYTIYTLSLWDIEKPGNWGWRLYNIQDNTYSKIINSDNYIFTTNDKTEYILYYYIGSPNTDIGQVTLSNIMLNEGSTAKPYEPYGEEICTNKLDGIQDALTDSSTPNLDGIEDSIGWLPPGPVDSILNLPLTMLNSLTNSLTKTCAPLNLTLPYINKNIQIPCLSAIFAQITGVNGLWTWVGTIASVLILYNYLLNLYAWVDRVLTLRAEFDEAMGADLANWGRL